MLAFKLPIAEAEIASETGKRYSWPSTLLANVYLVGNAKKENREKRVWAKY